MPSQSGLKTKSLRRFDSLLLIWHVVGALVVSMVCQPLEAGKAGSTRLKGHCMHEERDMLDASPEGMPSGPSGAERLGKGVGTGRQSITRGRSMRTGPPVSMAKQWLQAYGLEARDGRTRHQAGIKALKHESGHASHLQQTGVRVGGQHSIGQQPPETRDCRQYVSCNVYPQPSCSAPGISDDRHWARN